MGRSKITMGCGRSQMGPKHLLRYGNSPRYENLQYMYREELAKNRITPPTLKRYGTLLKIGTSSGRAATIALKRRAAAIELSRHLKAATGNMIRRRATRLKSDSAADSWYDPAVVPSSPTTTLDRAGFHKFRSELL